MKFGPDRDPISLTREHRLFRCVSDLLIDKDKNRPKPVAFDQAGMSVFVEGPGFEDVDFNKILELKEQWVAVASIHASEILDNNEFYGFELLHDPYGDEHGNQHDNHALVVCKKNATKGTRMQEKWSGWRVPPPT